MRFVHVKGNKNFVFFGNIKFFFVNNPLNSIFLTEINILSQTLFFDSLTNKIQSNVDISLENVEIFEGKGGLFHFSLNLVKEWVLKNQTKKINNGVIKPITRSQSGQILILDNDVVKLVNNLLLDHH